MALKSTSIAFLGLFVLGTSGAGAENRQLPSCPIPEQNKSWHLFTDPVQRFCFRYPTSYKLLAYRLKSPFVRKGEKLLAQFESTQGRNGRPADPNKAAIVLLLSEAPFNPQSFIREAPTGIESPPSPRRFGALTFLKYGPGGGGVSYDDVYYFDLRNQTLRIVFDGPFDGTSKSPSKETQQMERAMLESFRTF